MFLDFDVKTCSRQCSVSGNALAPGATVYSVLLLDGVEMVRHDFSADAWEGAPAEAIAWWQSQIPAPVDAKARLAPNDVLLNLLTALTGNPAERELRYVVGLLLIRRRVLRLEETHEESDGAAYLHTFCPRNKQHYEIQVATPDAEGAERLQQRVVELLYAGE